MAKKLRLLLLDANVVLELHSKNLWSPIVERCELLIARMVLEESMFYMDDLDEKVYVDLAPDEAASRLRVVDVDLPTINAFRSRFRRLFLEKMDDGEQEALAYLVEVNQECLISSADAVVWRTLGLLGLGEQGISLEEILAKVGLGTSLKWQFTRRFREKYTDQGFGERMSGVALRS